MEKQSYRNQVALLLDVLPEVSKEDSFALHGGTAINLFVRDMPRLSVDIDLTYIPIEDRTTSFRNIAAGLERIKANIEKTISGIYITHQEKVSKLLIELKGTQVKLEVNQTNRGLYGNSQTLELCEKAQEDFDVFCTMPVVSTAQLFGGKICAALDRQHPRDLFDVKYLLENEGFTEEIKNGFLYSLLCSNRPIYEMLFPNHIDQRATMENQFDGMSREEFAYEEFELVREKLVAKVQASLNMNDKTFLLGFVNTEPDWSIYDFEKYPSVQWKLQNLTSLKSNNPTKHSEVLALLKEKLSS